MKNLISIRDKVLELERLKFLCSWEDLPAVHEKIKFYQSMLSQGIHYEPAF